MDFTYYTKLVNQMKVGKVLPDAIYLHESALATVPYDLHSFLLRTIEKHEFVMEYWNVIKFFRKKFKISFLHYPTFFEESYPILSASYTIDLATSKVRSCSYENSSNPPILHRKETFLEQNHPLVHTFSEITREGENAGLYKNSRTIGFRKNWELLILEKGYTVIAGRLHKYQDQSHKYCTSVNSHGIARYKTAIDRNKLSTPMQSLFRHNYFDGRYSIFDYGCGKGDDLKILNEHGIAANGWDPIYRPNEPIKQADIINLGFVINVIESQTERKETLKKAFQLSKKILVASVMLGSESTTSQFEKYSDGIITSRNTFQKYYSQTEFREYLQDTLDETAIAVGPGVFFVFKDKDEEQSFLVERQRIKQNWQKLSYSDHPDRLKVKQRALYERHKELFLEFWQQCQEFGRLPSNNEFQRSEELRILCGSLQKGLDLLTTIYDQKTISKASDARRDDLLVHYALGLFSRRKPYINMPERLKRDVKHFFGNYTSAIKAATDLLFSVGKPELINHFCNEAYQKLGRGYFKVNDSLTIHRNDVELLPAALRVYIGCSTQLYGDIDMVDLVKIHIRSGKVSLMRYDDFEGKPLPLLLERIKIKLREQSIDFFEYKDQFKPHPLYLKSQYISENFNNYKNQLEFDTQLRRFDWIDLSGFGPTIEEFQNKLFSMEQRIIRGFKLISHQA